MTGSEEDPVSSVGTALFTLPQRSAKARRPEQHPRLPRLWVCTTHRHRQCATCAAVGRGVRHCCARGHASPPLHARAQPRGSTYPHVRCSHARKGGGYPGGASQGRGPAGAQGPSRASNEESAGGRRPPPPVQAAVPRSNKWPATGTRVRRPPNRPPPEVLTQARPSVANRTYQAPEEQATRLPGLLADLHITAPRAATRVSDPCGPPSLILFFPTHTHTHKHTHTHTHTPYHLMVLTWGT